MSTKVILVDDHQIILDSLTRLIDEEPDLAIVGVARNGVESIRLAEELRPEVAVIDISLPDMSGIETAERMLAIDPDLKVICLSMHHDMKNLIRMLRAGAKAYISKGSASRELIRAIRSVTNGNYFLCPELTTTMIELFLHSIPEDVFTSAPILSPREREVLGFLAEGANTKEIAYQLNLSPKTVDAHRHKIMRKLRVDSIAELVKYALREGLTTP